MKTVVIIPNYNGARFMNSCMSALKKQTYGNFCCRGIRQETPETASMKVLVVDNGSTDDSVKVLTEYRDRGEAEVIFLPENTGFSGAVNAGIRYCLAMAEVPEYIVLLNNDTEAEPEYLAAMAEVMEKDTEKKIGAVSPLMISMHDHSRIDSAGDGYCLLGWAFQRGVGRPVDLPKFRKATDVFSACAGAAMYRTEALREIAFAESEGKCVPAAGKTAGSGTGTGEGRISASDPCGRPAAEDLWVFDPAHFAYLEDVDVSMRLRIHGYRIVFEPASRVYHYGSGTSGSRYNEFKVRLAARNNVWLNCKNLPLLFFLIDLPFLLIGVLIKQMFFIFRGFGGAYWKGFWEGVGRLPRILKHRTYFRFGRTWNYIRIEGRMISDMASYLQDFFCRHLTDKKKRT